MGSCLSRAGSWMVVGATLVATLGLTACVSSTDTRNAPVGRTDSEVRTEAPTAAEVAQSTDRRANARLELASLYFSRGQITTALEEVRQALAANPALQEAHNLRGLILASQGETAQAYDSFQRALQLNPRDGDTRHNLAWVLCQQRRYADADAEFARAIALPQYGEAPRTLLARGVCQARDGHWAEAERTLSRAYELDPTNPATAYNLADVLLHRGELVRARFYVRRINAVPEFVSAQSLWLAARVERRIGNIDGVQDFGRQLRERFPQSPEALQFERGRFDD